MTDNNKKEKTYNFYKMLVKRSEEARKKPKILKNILNIQVNI